MAQPIKSGAGITSVSRSRSLRTPSIFRAGLAMVLLPCLVGSVFQLALGCLWISTGKLAAERHARNEGTVQLTSSFKELVTYGYDRMTYAFQNAPDAGKRAAADRGRLLQCAARLREVAAQGNASVHDFDQASTMFCSILDDAEKLTGALDANNFSNNVQRLASYGSLLRSGLQLSSQIQQTVKRQSLLQDQLRRQQDLLNQVIRGVVLIGFGCTIVLSSLLLLGFIRDVLIRLKQLTDNARALSRSGKQLSDIGGDDELTYLDSVFHDVAEELQSAREQHNLIMQMVAHDLRSPIMATQVYVQVYEELLGPRLSQTAAKWCDSITVNSSRVLSFVTELLALEKVESGGVKLQYSQFEIVELVQECQSSLSALADEKNIVLTNACENLTVNADRGRVLHVLMNYLSNAIKFSPIGAKVATSARQEADGSITLFVEDNGPGLSKEMADHVFDKFYQGPEERSGFGLGLSICRKLIEAHDGRAGVNSVAGSGSQFWFSLPNRPARPAPSQGDGQLNHQSIFSDLLKPGLVRQGLILTLLPFLAQAAWLAWMNGQLSKSEKLERLERKQSDLVARVNGFWLATYDANSNLAFYIVRHEDKYRQRAQKNFLQLRQTQVELDGMASSPAEDMALWREARSFVVYETGRLEQLLNDSSSQSASSDLGGLSKVFARAEALANRIETLEKGELRRLAVIQQEQERFLNGLQGLLFGAFALNTLMYSSLWLFFRNRFVKRLDVLVDCAKQLPSRQPVTAPVAGNDELASLSVQLQKAAVDLKGADDQRKAVLSMVSHDIRSPLMAMEVSLTMLENAGSASSEREEESIAALQSARGNIERVLALVNDLLILDKVEAGMIELLLADCSSSDLVAASVSSIASLALVKGISLQLDCIDVQVQVDRARMIQVIVNLLGNAIKFSPENSSIKVAAKENRDGLLISIKDSGPGMDPETSTKVFDKYFSAGDQPEAAFGLGLAICKLIVDSHGGKIGVESRLGEGSNFWIVIPLSR